MIRINFLLGVLFLTAFLISCTGSKKDVAGGLSTTAVEQDIQLRAKIKDLQEKIKKNPNTMDYREELADLYFENGHTLEAMKTLEEALKIDPHNAEVQYKYGDFALKSGDKRRAFIAFKAVMLGPDADAYLDRISPYFVDAFNVTPVVQGEANEAFGAFSADGNQIIYQSDQNGNWDLFILDLTTNEVKQITNSSAHEENPSFSPDGVHIVYTSTEDDHRDVDFSQKLRDIYVMDLITGETENLTKNGSDDWHPKYSFSGDFIVFVSQRNDLREVPFYEMYSDIFIMQNNGRFQLSLTRDEFNDGSPALMPGSTDEEGTVVFDSDRSGSFAIYKMDIRTKVITQLTHNPDVNDVSPDVSSSGDKITFFSDRDGNYEIYLMNNDGSAQQRLTSNPAEDLNPVFSPDGNKILFHSDREGNFDLYLLDLTQSAEQISVSEVLSRIDQALQKIEEEEE
ncbi:tetratricopeptide repeat protein [Calditrichota bacterium LG25]